MQLDGTVWSVAFVVIVSVTPPAPLEAQGSTAGGFDVGLSIGLFGDYPSDFSRQSCEQRAGGFAAKISRGVTWLLALETSAVAAFGVGDMICAFPASPAPRDGDHFNRATFEDGIVGQSFFATTVSAVLQPMATSTLSPRLRFGGGRLWDKRLWTWIFGGGLRLRFGANAVTADVERWNLSYDLNLELLIYRESGAHELQRVDVLPRRPGPYLFRVGWERQIG